MSELAQQTIYFSDHQSNMLAELCATSVGLRAFLFIAAASEMTYIVSGGALNSTHSLTGCKSYDRCPLLHLSHMLPLRSSLLFTVCETLTHTIDQSQISLPRTKIHRHAEFNDGYSPGFHIHRPYRSPLSDCECATGCLA